MNGHVIKAHKSSYPDPIEFNAKDRLEVGAEDVEYPGWIWVTTRDGNQGWAPIEYIERIEETRHGTAKSSYCARELNLEVGEKLQISATVSGWHYATNARAETGWLPHDCVEFTSP